MKKELEIGRNYWTVFGDNNGNQMLYLGGVKFRAVNGTTGAMKEIDSQDTYDKVSEYINRPTVQMGMPK